jgi:hypothetical protein
MKKRAVLGSFLLLLPIVANSQSFDHKKGNQGPGRTGQSKPLGSTSTSPRLISIYTQSTPGPAEVPVPANAVTAMISAVGGGAGGPSGGGAGAVVNFPVSVAQGQIITVEVGAGGSAMSNGEDTVVSLGALTLTCGGGSASAPGSTNGGNGGSVNLGFATIPGGPGGQSQQSGGNGTASYFAYSGGGGGSPAGGNGGNVLLFLGGTQGSGSGASAMGNAGTAGQQGSRGSGGGASAAGGDGYVEIVFYR